VANPDDRHFGRHFNRDWEPIRVVCLNAEYDNGSSKSKAKHA